MKRRRSAAPAKAAPQPTKAPETPETKALTIDERNGLLRQCALPWSDVAAADFCATLPRHLLQEMTLAYVKANRKPDVLRTIGKIAALSFPDALTVQYVGKLPEVSNPNIFDRFRTRTIQIGSCRSTHTHTRYYIVLRAKGKDVALSYRV
jgi:hypothetical protein